MTRCESLRQNEEVVLKRTRRFLRENKILGAPNRILVEAPIKSANKVGVKPTNKKEIPAPTLPLPKNDTGTKEGLAIYFAT